MKIFMSKLNKKYFNMVEIVLALAVVSVAIVSLMGMLPVALRASKNSVADNSVAAVVEIMKSFIDRQYKSKTEFSGSGSFQAQFTNVKPTAAAATVLDYNDTNDKYPSLSSDLQKYAFQITNGNTAGTYRVELFSGEFDSGKFAVTDFDADVRIWYNMLDGEIYIPIYTNSSYANNFYKKDGTYEVPLSHGCTFYVEVSWPSGVKYENQEHRLYKFDYFKKVD